MSAETKSDLRLEIAHVLFIDIVGYSKLLINEQHESLQELNQIVRGTEAFRAAETAGQLTRIPTGDGMALVFSTTPDAPVQCALEIGKALKSRPDLRVRMGIHSGPVSAVTDVNDHSNVAGGGINMAQRVMDCGDAGHILLSKRVAEDLAQYRQWQPALHDLGECEVKHGVRVHVVNLYTDEAGNSALPARFVATKKTERASGKRLTTFQIALVLLVALISLGIPALIFTPAILKSQRSRPKTEAALPTVSGSAIADKSIAVLPFENLSRDPDNAYFADGIQDEILTRLAKIADLKVISRTSTQRYKSSQENLPEIAKQLGVAHVLEGSVQKAGGQVRVTMQLIRAATDSHLWAETYDRNLTDIFAVQSEIAENIAKSLRARFTGSEQQAVAAKPTENPEAYEAYLRGLALWNKLSSSPQDVENTVLYFARAVQLDPTFARAWASLSVAHTFIYAEFDRTPQRLAQVKLALDSAVQLQPEAGETYFAEGMYRYRGLADYDGALVAFQKARGRSANRVEAIEFTAYVKRRQAKWDEALALHTESLELDPRNTILLSEAALTYRALRRFDEARALLDRGLEIEPNSPPLLILKAETHEAEGDSETAGRLLERVPVGGQDVVYLGSRVRHWIFVRQYGEAIRAVRDALAAPEHVPKSYLPIFRLWLGMVESLASNPDTAKAELSQARDELLAIRAQGDRGSRIASHLIFAYGFLGDKAGVDREAAVIQDEIEKDAVGGPGLAQMLAAARAQLGETDAAIASVTHLLKTPGESSLTPALLRMDPLWDPLRGDPRFQKLCDEKKP